MIATALTPALAWPTFGIAQAKRQPVLVGVLNFGSATPGTSLAAFRKELATRGWKEGAITGVSNIVSDTSSKFVELLVAAVPGLKRIGFLVDASGPGAAIMMASIGRSATHYSLEASFVEVRRREEIEPGLQRLSQRGMQALASMPSPMLAFERKEILQFAAAQRWPVISNNTGWVRDGALLSYGAETNAQFRRAAYYVDRILRGAKPADLPVELPTTFAMAVNLKTAKALSITLPPQIMVRANVVIE